VTAATFNRAPIIHLELPAGSLATPVACGTRPPSRKLRSVEVGANTRYSADTLPRRDRVVVPRSPCPLPDARRGSEAGALQNGSAGFPRPMACAVEGDHAADPPLGPPYLRGETAIAQPPASRMWRLDPAFNRAAEECLPNGEYSLPYQRSITSNQSAPHGPIGRHSTNP
jgi:hypothetical protein